MWNRGLREYILPADLYLYPDRFAGDCQFLEQQRHMVEQDLARYLKYRAPGQERGSFRNAGALREALEKTK